MPVTLQIGQLTDTVTVTADTPLLRTANAEIAEIIDNRQVEQLPLNGRQFIQLAQLTDGVTIPPGGTRGAALGQAGPLPNVYGQRGGHNIYLIDGVKVTDEYFNNLVISPSVDAIQEFKIQKTMYPAEFGGKASALINVVTKSGTNALHGSALAFFRNESVRRPQLLRRSRRSHIRACARTSSASTSAARSSGTGRSSSSATRASRSGRRRPRRSPCRPQRCARGDFSGLPPLCDPLTRTAAGTCTPFPGNQIPANRLSPVASPCSPKCRCRPAAGLVQNLLGVEDEVNPMNQFSLRLDHRFGVDDNLYGRFTTFRVHDTQPFGTSSLNEALVPGFGRTVTTESENVALGHTHTFGSSWLNEIRFGYLRARGGQVSPNQGVNFAARCPVCRA